LGHSAYCELKKNKETPNSCLYLRRILGDFRNFLPMNTAGILQQSGR